jgi:type III pantothenate kinase
MGKTLCFDFGNTRLKCGVFDGKELVEVVTMEDDSDKAVQELLKTYTTC